MATGRVNWFNPWYGYGFITPDSGGPDIFAHGSDIDAPLDERELSDGDRVSFEVRPAQPGEKRDRAVKIKVR